MYCDVSVECVTECGVSVWCVYECVSVVCLGVV